ncbi:MAG TPA: WecB/TagA/CpsF family glycosyltransferase [Candidatus Dormibacteraeota bacterium]|nr:WecB/TagA/CpsF family glycosyltransferase [Candidatus Dormibacteraeota bacterium]
MSGRTAASHRHRLRAPGDEVTLLGVRFDRLSRADSLAALSAGFRQGEAWKVYIVNAHTLNLAWRDRAFREVLNGADLLLNDGTGVNLAGRLAGKRFPDNLVGTDLVPQLCERAVSQGVGVFLLGGKEGVADSAAERLRLLIPGLRIQGSHHGYFSESETDRVVEQINRSGAGILLVAFGNPLQELWIHRHSPQLRCDLSIGVGGLFHYLAGHLGRAPLWMRRAGIEWVHILMRQPHKWRRYLLGNPLFVVRALTDRLGWGP